MIELMPVNLFTYEVFVEKIGKNVVIEKDVVINVKHLEIGDRSIIRSGSRIEGTLVSLGTECYLDHGAWIGGGSCHDDDAYLICGDWLHMGWNSQINIARGVRIGDQVGLGVETKIFTHGAYLPEDYGFPVQWGSVEIGSYVWLPNAWVNPNVKIGSYTVVAARSLVNCDLPMGCLAGGIPVKIIKRNAYPKKTFINYDDLSSRFPGLIFESDKIICDNVIFDLSKRVISGKSTEKSEKLKNQLRRNGIRFKYFVDNIGDDYGAW